MNAARAERGTGPLIFGVAFWGEQFRHTFVEYCLASLLAPGNIPAIATRQACRFLFCTTSEDWSALQGHPLYQRLRRWVEPEWLPMEAPSPQAQRVHGIDAKLRAMSDAHRRLAQHMHAARAVGAFIYPDTVFADGAYTAARKWIEDGKDVVLAFCPRLADDTILDVLGKYRSLGSGDPLPVAPRTLVEASLAHMHAEMRSCEWASRAFSYEPTACWWRARHGDGLLCHSLIWYPILINYGAISDHNDMTFSAWTIDGDYIYRNFSESERLQVVDDSDVLMLTSFSPAAAASAQQPVKCLPFLGPFFMRLILRNYLHSGQFDPQKRELFRRPIRLHTGELDPAWSALESEAGRVIAAAAAPLTPFEQRIFIGLRILNEGIRLHLGYWLLKRANGLPPAVRTQCLRTLGGLHLIPARLLPASHKEKGESC